MKLQAPAGKTVLRHATIPLPRPLGRLIGVMALAAMLVWLAKPAIVIAAQTYLPLHTIAEIFAVVVAMLVFACAWHAGGAHQPGNIALLGCAFLSVGLLDLGHLLSFHGMPHFVTPSGPEKAINFWLAGRIIEAGALLLAVSTAWQPLAPAARRRLLAGSLALTGAVYWAVLFHPERLPHTFVPELGLTPLKVGTEYLIVALHIAAAVILLRPLAHKREFDAANLFAAAVAMGLSELFFAGYRSVTDLYNLTGHVYKVLAYVFVYRAVFVDSVRRPVQALLAAEEREKRLLQGVLAETTTELAISEQRYLYLRELAAHREHIKEAERKRIARDIHDDLGQTLLALRIDVSLFADRIAQTHPRLHDKVSSMLSHIDAATKSMRSVINDLRPSVLDLGLLAAIEWQVREFRQRTGIACELDVDDEQFDFGLDEQRATALFRVVQESLSNIIRHAQATQVRITVRAEDGTLDMTIADNGVGIGAGTPKTTHSFGLAGIEERIHALGGSFTVDSKAGHGTQLRFSVPMAMPATVVC